MYRILLYVICIKSINKHIDTKSKKFDKVLLTRTYNDKNTL